VAKQAFYQKCRKSSHGSHSLRVALPLASSPSLLDRVQERPDVEGSLRQLKRHRLKERENVVYIPPQAKASLQDRDLSCFQLMEKVEEFLKSDQKVFLLLGDSGAGKSMFNRELECHLWRSYKTGGAIPIHINLPAIHKPEQDMIAKQLRKAEFTEPQIRELKLCRKVILICDGYDESQQTHNLYTSNRLNQPGEWNAVMVISCRSEYIGVDYRDRFQPVDRNHRSDPTWLQEAVLTPFSMVQVQNYITQYVSVCRPLWDAGEYRRALERIPSLKELVKNPFLMSLSLEVLPRMIDPGQDLSVAHITRMALYDQFIEHWLERGKKRLGEMALSPQAGSAFERLVEEGFIRSGIDYLKKLSAAIYKEQCGQPIVTYSRYKDEDSWKGSFFSRDEEKQLLREACPLIRNGNQHRFIHRSLLEYGVTLSIFDPNDWRAKPVVQEPKLARRGSVSTVASSDVDDPEEEQPVAINHGPNSQSPLVWESFINEPSVLQFLVERLQHEPLFKQQLLDYIEHSKVDKKWRTAAANAISILVGAGVQFNGANLRGIRIPGANLSYGMFQSAQLQGADLRRTRLRGIWLRKADLSHARMKDIQCAELLFLKQEYRVMQCLYSPDGETIALTVHKGIIAVYSTSDWKFLRTLDGHCGYVINMEYSPDSSKIVSSSIDRTIRLWDIRTGNCIRILNAHGGETNRVAYSPRGNQVISSEDRTIKLWDVKTGKCRRIWNGHTDSILSVVCSPRGTQVASNSRDHTVRLWSIGTDACLHVLRGHDRHVNGIAYSPQGDQIASASNDATMRLWDVATGNCYHVIGHGDAVLSVMYSPNGHQVASANMSGSVGIWDVETGACLRTLPGHHHHSVRMMYSPRGDMVAVTAHGNTVNLWDSESGVCLQTLAGHSKPVKNFAFSPKGDQVVSVSDDKTVRLWDVRAGTSRYVLSGHDGRVCKMERSPKGDLVATCSDDKTIRLWDVEAGACHRVLRGHSGTVQSVAFSPQGDQIASCSEDSTVRLWNTGTGACTHTLTGHSDIVWDIAFSCHGDQLASGCGDCSVRLWNVVSGECSYILVGHTESIAGVMYSPNDSQLVSYSDDSTLRIWDVETGACIATLTGHTDRIFSVAHSPQGDQLASTSEDGTVRVWDIRTGECSHIFIGHRSWATSIKYSPKGGQIASLGRFGRVRAWEIESGTCLWTVGLEQNINTIVYSPSGELLISACSDHTVRLWDASSGQCRAVIQDFQDEVVGIAWIEAPVSGIHYLVAGCRDGMVGMWQVVDDDADDENHYRVSLRWMPTKGVLDLSEAVIQDVQGLSQFNKQLLEQRGAVGKPTLRCREATKTLATITSMVSKLQMPSDKAAEGPSSCSCSCSCSFTGSALIKELEQKFQENMQQEKDSFFQDVMAVVKKNIYE